MKTGRESVPGPVKNVAEPFLRFWGVRGSVPVPGPETARYGGNTACVEVRAAGQLLILDAGTGLRPLGEALSAEFGARPVRASLFITHPHWDHVQGFPFFKPLYDATTHLRVFGFEAAGEGPVLSLPHGPALSLPHGPALSLPNGPALSLPNGFASVFARQMAPPYFPLSLAQVPARVLFEELGSMELQLGPIQVQAAFVNHPGVCAAYRLEGAGLSIAYMPDHEPFHRAGPLGTPPMARIQASVSTQGEDEGILAFLRGVRVLIVDAQYDTEEYPTRIGWGHSSVEDAVGLAARAGAQRLFLFHHDPSHTDARMDGIVQYARNLAAKLGSALVVDAAREGVQVQLGRKE